MSICILLRSEAWSFELVVKGLAKTNLFSIARDKDMIPVHTVEGHASSSLTYQHTIY